MGDALASPAASPAFFPFAFLLGWPPSARYTSSPDVVVASVGACKLSVVACCFAAMSGCSRGGVADGRVIFRPRVFPEVLAGGDPVACACALGADAGWSAPRGGISVAPADNLLILLVSLVVKVEIAQGAECD